MSSTKKESQTVIASYMNYALEVPSAEHSVYHFCKNGGINEAEFYNHFSDLEHIKSAIWVEFYNESLKLLEKDPHFNQADFQEKSLSLLYTMFELFKSNRSYILWTLSKKDLKKLNELKDLRKELKTFIQEAITTNSDDKIENIRTHSTSELYWVQFLSILNYWTQDRSPSFEKTDVLIEKSSAVLNDLTQKNPLNNLVDLGKFLGKEFVI